VEVYPTEHSEGVAVCLTTLPRGIAKRIFHGVKEEGIIADDVYPTECNEGVAVAGRPRPISFPPGAMLRAGTTVPKHKKPNKHR
jgi:hypothetical protein